MKKIKAFALAFALMLSAFALPASTAAFAWIGDRYESDEIAFTTILEEMRDEFGVDYISYTYERAALYNSADELSGYVYDFCLDGIQDGCMLMVKLEYGDEMWYEVTEIYLGQSPFYQNSGVNIYPTFRTYISLESGVYIDLGLNLVITYEVLLELEAKGFGFSASAVYVSWTEQVDYAARTITKNTVSAGSMPALTYGTNNGNCCAVVAGSNIINYWAYYLPDLVPGVAVATIVSGEISWKGDSSQNFFVADELYDWMGTNLYGPGTSIGGFKSGIDMYAALYGDYFVKFRSVMTSGSYDINKMLTEFAANRPVALFMNPYFNVSNGIGTYGGGAYDIIYNYDFTGAHAMTASGRHVYKWYDAGGTLIREIQYLRVSSSMLLPGLHIGWMRLNEGFDDINDAFSVEIYDPW